MPVPRRTRQQKLDIASTIVSPADATAFVAEEVKQFQVASKRAIRARVRLFQDAFMDFVVPPPPPEQKTEAPAPLPPLPEDTEVPAPEPEKLAPQPKPKPRRKRRQQKPKH